MTKENLNTLGVILAAGLGIILTYWVSYYFWNRPEPSVKPCEGELVTYQHVWFGFVTQCVKNLPPTYSPAEEPTKEWPAELNHDKG